MTVPAGSPLLVEGVGSPVSVNGVNSVAVTIHPRVLLSSDQKLPMIKVRLAYPKGSGLKSLRKVIINIPPGGSAGSLVPDECARLGVGSAAIQSAAQSKHAYLASLAIAVANHMRTLNPSLKIVFAGFSAGGFAAELAARHLAEHCIGVLQMGSFTGAGSPPLPESCPIIMLVGEKDYNYPGARQGFVSHTGYGSKITLLTHLGGHTTGSASDQKRMVRALFGDSPTSSLAPNQATLASIIGSGKLVEWLSHVTPEEGRRVLGKTESTALVQYLNPNQRVDWRRAASSPDFARDFPAFKPLDGKWKLPLTGIRNAYVQVTYGSGANSRILFEVDGSPSDWKTLAKAIQIPLEQATAEPGKSEDGDAVTRLLFKEGPLAKYEVTTQEVPSAQLVNIMFRLKDVESVSQKVVATALIYGKKIGDLFFTFNASGLTPQGALQRVGIDPKSVTITASNARPVPDQAKRFANLREWNVKSKVKIKGLRGFSVYQDDDKWTVAVRAFY